MPALPGGAQGAMLASGLTNEYKVVSIIERRKGRSGEVEGVAGIAARC
ncbi:hypothetical protein SPIROBIBN47_210054 [uncultured spirochete]|uniref:Uncharacterized protein n=1 Tax=uncultured spirochete TaxID=156406 RepID=A0A3P3XHC9_9SPIR|nr:hypothetical protein SPIROBIBN47_210054 [uncultured spirochete]